MLGNLLTYAALYFGLFAALFFMVTFFENSGRLKNPEPRMFPKVTVAVAVYNGEDHISKTVESLLNIDWPREKLEVIIVDDGSTDNSYTAAKKYASDKRVVLLQQENRGKNKAVNVALKLATGEFFGVLDVDSFVERDCLRKMMGYFENERVMAVTPSLKVYGAKTWLQKIQMMEFLLGVYLRKVFSFLGAIHVTPGCFSIYRKAFFDRTGPYDEENLTEDIEVACRIQCNDYAIENAIDANVYTQGFKKFGLLYNQRLRWYKGFIDNVISYKRMLHPKFGNLGMFVLPSAFLSVFLTSLLSAYMLVKLGQGLWKQFTVLKYTGFDLTQYLHYDFDLFYISNFNAILILNLIALAWSITAVYLAKKHSGEKSSIILPFVIFMFTYVFLYPFWWAGAGYCRLTGKKIRWGNRYL